METTNMEAAIAKADELFAKEKPSGKRGKRAAFSLLTRSAFEKVFKARTEGFSFVQICAVFEQVGLLPENTRPSSLRQTFYREEARRKKMAALSKQILGGKLAINKDAAKPNASEAETEEERIKRLTRGTIKTGDGKIIKNPDGSFDF